MQATFREEQKVRHRYYAEAGEARRTRSQPPPHPDHDPAGWRKWRFEHAVAAQFRELNGPGPQG
jgi:hypothetical protein